MYVTAILKNRWLHISLLLIITWACFARTLSNYFLADDFGELAYVSQILQGHPEYIWANWLGPYLNNPTICVYRPIMQVTQIFDYLIWGARPFGFYLSNLLYYSGDVLLLYVLMRQLFARYRGMLQGSDNSLLVGVAAFFSAALFAVNPLHCESVSWVVGRVDVDCCFYYLLSLALLLRKAHKPSRILHILGLVSFALALGIKEMAIGLPFVLTSVFYLFPQESSVREHKSAGLRLRGALSRSKSTWAVLAAYLVVRFLALGTLAGGYGGSIGRLQCSAAFAHWADIDIWKRIFTPIHGALTGQTLLYTQLIEFWQWSLIAIILSLVMAGALSLRWITFLCVWALTTMVPLYQLWGLGEYLEGSRFLFFFTMPLSALAPVIIFSGFEGGYNGALLWLYKRLGAIAVLLLTGLVITLGRACYFTNLLWVHAGKEVHSIINAAPVLVATHPRKSMVLLGLPDDHLGVHEIINANVFRTMMQLPFSAHLADRFFIFGRLRYEPSQYINGTVLKQALADPQNIGPYVWDRSKQQFELVPLQLPNSPGADLLCAPERLAIASKKVPGHFYPYSLGRPRYVLAEDTARLIDLKPGDGLYAEGLHLNPWSADYLEFEYRNAIGSGIVPCRVLWNVPADRPPDAIVSGIGTYGPASDTVSLPCSIGKFSKVTIKLSRYWQWFVAPEITSLSILFGSFPEIEVRKLRLCSAKEFEPQVVVTNCRLNRCGVYNISQPNVRLAVTTPPGATCCGFRIEISRPNFFFEQPANNQDATASVIKLEPGKTFVLLSFPLDPQSAYYQVRAVCINADNSLAGQYCDPITFYRAKD